MASFTHTHTHILELKSSSLRALNPSKLHIALLTFFNIISLSNQTEKSLHEDLKLVPSIYDLSTRPLLNKLEKKLVV
jgi:hypothetical protein